LVDWSLMKKIKYPSVEQAEWSHNRILEATGGERGDLAKANLEFVFERVKDIGEALERNEAVVKKAAFLLHSLVTQHPFINGNKRTAFEVVDAFLELNGYVLQAETDVVYGILSDLGAGKLSQAQVEDWIVTNLAERRRRSKRRS
jgi:death on curing protein